LVAERTRVAPWSSGATGPGPGPPRPPRREPRRRRGPEAGASGTDPAAPSCDGIHPSPAATLSTTEAWRSGATRRTAVRPPRQRRRRRRARRARGRSTSVTSALAPSRPAPDLAAPELGTDSATRQPEPWRSGGPQTHRSQGRGREPGRADRPYDGRPSIATSPGSAGGSGSSDVRRPDAARSPGPRRLRPRRLHRPRGQRSSPPFKPKRRPRGIAGATSPFRGERSWSERRCGRK